MRATLNVVHVGLIKFLHGGSSGNFMIGLSLFKFSCEMMWSEYSV